MAASSGAHYSFSVQGNPTPPRYEQLKEDHDPVLVGAGVPLPSTVVHMQQVYVQPPSPRDHFVWSLFSTLYLNFCCLGLLALNFSVKARDRKLVGDHNGASSYGSTAKCLNVMALMLCLLLIILVVILISSGAIVVSQILKSLSETLNGP